MRQCMLSVLVAGFLFCKTFTAGAGDGSTFFERQNAPGSDPAVPSTIGSYATAGVGLWYANGLDGMGQEIWVTHGYSDFDKYDDPWLSPAGLAVGTYTEGGTYVDPNNLDETGVTVSGMAQSDAQAATSPDELQPTVNVAGIHSFSQMYSTTDEGIGETETSTISVLYSGAIGANGIPGTAHPVIWKVISTDDPPPDSTKTVTGEVSITSQAKELSEISGTEVFANITVVADGVTVFTVLISGGWANGSYTSGGNLIMIDEPFDTEAGDGSWDFDYIATVNSTIVQVQFTVIQTFFNGVGMIPGVPMDVGGSDTNIGQLTWNVVQTIQDP
jgi:hypothetical protein